MFDIFAKLLSSVASFLFPVFASYKALKTADPAQLTPWLMYWVVFGCALLVESWTEWFLSWIPFYAYIRLAFLLYLVLPQTQGARILYQTHLHPYLESNEAHIEDLIATAHERLRTTGLSSLRSAIAYLKTMLLGLPAEEHTPEPPAPAWGSAQGYTQGLLARFSVPSAGLGGAGAAGADFYNFLSSAVAAAVSTGAGGGAGAQDVAQGPGGGSLVPANLHGAERASFIEAQRARLTAVLGALDSEAKGLEREETLRAAEGGAGESEGERPLSGLSSRSGMSKSRSEVEFEKIDAESGAEEEDGVRRRKGGWMPFGWGVGPAEAEGAGAAGGAK